MYYHISRNVISTGRITPTYYTRLIGNLNSHEFHNQYMKEVAFDETRTSNFPDMPCRLNSIFLFDTIEKAKIYKNKQRYVKDGVIYEIELIGSGKIAEFDMNWLECNFAEYHTIKENAMKYYSKSLSNSPNLEIVYEGEAIVGLRIEL